MKRYIVDTNHFYEIREWSFALGPEFHTDVPGYLAKFDYAVNPQMPPLSKLAREAVFSFGRGSAKEPLKQLKPKKGGKKAASEYIKDQVEKGIGEDRI